MRGRRKQQKKATGKKKQTEEVGKKKLKKDSCIKRPVMQYRNEQAISRKQGRDCLKKLEMKLGH